MRDCAGLEPSSSEDVDELESAGPGERWRSLSVAAGVGSDGGGVAIAVGVGQACKADNRLRFADDMPCLGEDEVASREGTVLAEDVRDTDALAATLPEW